MNNGEGNPQSELENNQNQQNESSQEESAAPERKASSPLSPEEELMREMSRERDEEEEQKRRMNEEKTEEQKQEQAAETGAQEGPGVTAEEVAEASEGAELEQARKEAQEMKDAWTRERAEFINYKKRSSQEHARARITAVTNFVNNLLPVLDNLNRVLQVETEDPGVKNVITGVDMIRNEFLDVLNKEKIQPVNPVGEPFDPFVMEAIAMEDREDLERDTVLEVYQDGYIYSNDEGEKQVIRPARVKVGKKV